MYGVDLVGLGPFLPKKKQRRGKAIGEVSLSAQALLKRR
jgi:hypothetical protein